MRQETQQRLGEIIRTYDEVMRVMEHDAAKAVAEDARAYGGFVRAAKGKIQEYITDKLIRIAWNVELGRDPRDLEINSDKIKIPVRKEYVMEIKDQEIRDYILKNIDRYYYGLSVDKHVFIRGVFVLGVECKAYTENAMLKRILVDFYLLKTRSPNILCYLFQLESQLGGDYSSVGINPKGSLPTHAIMSYFPEVKLNIVTLLAGERKVDQPINKIEYFKSLSMERLEVGLCALIDGFKPQSLAD